MSDYDDLVASLGGTNHWRMSESSGSLLDSLGGRTMSAQGTPEYGVAGPSIDGDTAIRFNVPLAVTDYFRSASVYNLFSGATQFSLVCWVRTDATVNRPIFNHRIDASRQFTMALEGGNSVNLFYWDGANGLNIDFADGIDFTSWRQIGIAFNNGVVLCTLDGVEVETFSGSAFALWNSSQYMRIANNTVSSFSGDIGKVSTFRGVALAESDFADLVAAAGVSSPTVLPMLLTGGLLAAASSLPMWLRTSELAGAASVPMKLQAPDPAHYQATKAKWDVQVLLDNVDISDRLVGLIEISHEESASGTCTVRIIPAAGAIDPDAFERKPLVIEFQGKNDAGTIIYASRRFTGISSGAIYDPDAGIVAIEGTTDLQGRIENMSRDTIAALVGGEWSEHVFDEDADNWQYAQDRLSTTPTEIHANRFGSIVAAPWAAKATADIELTDADIEDKQFTIARTKRRDLVTRVRINLDFRFVRLRHREVQVNFANSFGFCHYLNWNWPLCSRDMVRSAADSNEWVRITDIAFIGLPVAGTYCTPSRGWVGGADAFCLGASWRSAMRWAQTVTEEYAIDVVATDLEEAVGQQQVAESYGIEATYDGNDFEAVKAYSTSPLGAVFSTVTADWQKEATDSERDGRAAMEYAQEVAIARARTTMLDRARRNRLTVYPVYDPSIDIDQTVRVATTYLTAKGKVAAMREMMDTSDGDIVMAVEIALSRHGGTGLASDDPIEAAEQPDQPTEEPTPRVYYVPYRMGGLVNAPQDDDEWDGYMTNVQESLRDPSGGVYQQRLVLKMPAIEESARDAQAIPQTASFEVEIPEDELTMSY